MATVIKTLPSGVQYKLIDGAYGGLVGNEADIVSMTNNYNRQTSEPVVAEDIVVDEGTEEPFNPPQQILDVGQPTFSTGSPTAAENLIEAPAPTQTTEDLVSALGDATESDTETYKYGSDKDDKGKKVTFADGSVLTQKGYRFEYEDADGNPLELDIQPGLKQSVDSKNEALSAVVGSIKSDLTEDVYGDFGGEDGTLVSEYLSDQAALAAKRARTDERQDEAMFGKGGTMDQLNDQVAKEAAALGITTEAYYRIPVLTRINMGLSDIGEVFDSSQGELFQNPDDIDPNNPRNLGVLGSENLEKYKKDLPPPVYTDLGMSPGAMGGPPPQGGPTGDQFFDGFEVPIGPGGPSGPGAGSNTGSGGSNVGGGGDGNGGQPDDDFNDIGGGIGVGVPVIGPGDIGGGTGGTGGGIGGGIGTGGIGGSQPDPNTFIVPSTANYGEDPRFANLAPTYKVSNAAMPVFNRFDPAPSIPPVQPIGLLAQGGIVSLQEGGEPFRNKMGVIDDGNIRDGERYYFEDYETDEMDPQMLISPERLKDRQDTDVIRMAETPKGQGITPELPPAGTDIRSIPIDVLLDPRSVIHGVSDREGKIEILKSMGIIQTAFSGGIVSLAGGGTPKGAGITPPHMIDYYNKSLIPRALDGDKVARDYLLEAHSNFDNFTLPEELLLKIKYSSFRHGGVAERGYSHEGVGSLSDTARNMFRPMVS